MASLKAADQSKFDNNLPMMLASELASCDENCIVAFC